MCGTLRPHTALVTESAHSCSQRRCTRRYYAAGKSAITTAGAMELADAHGMTAVRKVPQHAATFSGVAPMHVST
jgi:hypothetical protein